jgi:hypothetical protein
MKTLLAHLESLNAEKQAWIDEDPTNRWTGMYTTDMDHWASMGIVTVEDFERDQLISSIWDAYKDAYGYRPRHLDFESMTMAELEAEADSVFAAADAQYEYEKAREAEDLTEFKALVQKTIELGAGDEETALRWLVQDEEFYSVQDVEHFIYNKGILFTDYGKEMVKRIDAMIEYEEWEVA